jgi:GxxExxY protein
MDIDTLSNVIIGAGILVHKALGPGLLESSYEACTAYDLTERGIPVERQVPLPIQYKGVRLDCGYRLDMVVDRRIIVEFKSVTNLVPIHDAQMLTYLRLSNLTVGLIMNFNVVLLKDGIRRIVREYRSPAL